MKNRGFEKVSFSQFEKDLKDHKDIKRMYNELKLPIRMTKKSVAYDFFAPFDFVLTPGTILKIPSGIKSYMLDDEVLILVNRSGLGFNYNIRFLNQIGLIDADYYNNKSNEGHMWIAIKNEGDKDLAIKRGERFFQGFFVKYLITDDDNATGIREGGLGSTGKEN